jgi:hypothetical protein
VAVDETRDSARSTAVHFLDVAVECRQVSHPPDSLDLAVSAEDVRVLEHLDLG